MNNKIYDVLKWGCYYRSTVHSALQTMKTLCKEYYNSEIVPTLFEYEFIK